MYSRSCNDPSNVICRKRKHSEYSSCHVSCKVHTARNKSKQTSHHVQNKSYYYALNICGCTHSTQAFHVCVLLHAIDFAVSCSALARERSNLSCCCFLLHIPFYCSYMSSSTYSVVTTVSSVRPFGRALWTRVREILTIEWCIVQVEGAPRCD